MILFAHACVHFNVYFIEVTCANVDLHQGIHTYLYVTPSVSSVGSYFKHVKTVQCVCSNLGNSRAHKPTVDSFCLTFERNICSLENST